jgi:Tfp pilus assembly pilus retraction ATPase PilT
MNQEKLLSELLTSLIHEDGSDLHLGSGRKPAMRINGQLLFLVNKEVMTSEDMVGILTVLIGKDRTDKFLVNKEVDFSYIFMLAAFCVWLKIASYEFFTCLTVSF